MVSLKRIAKLLRWGILALLLVVVVVLLLSPFYLYHRFNAEYPVAKLRFYPLGQQRYLAEIRSGDFCTVQRVVIYGDQWRLDAAVLKWKGVAVAMGLPPKYRLERITGRYKKITEQNRKPQLAHALGPPVWLDIFSLENLLGESHHLVDTVFGSSVYLDMDPTKSYRVYMTEDALIAKSRPLVSAGADQTMITVEINHACGDQWPFLERLIIRVNQLVVKYLGQP